uniref:Ig-like domain-containing protein n=1 Tax=Oncorhynchus kisutch TaxID=8019 RepID=A0A8C7HSE6_ONCKI
TSLHHLFSRTKPPFTSPIPINDTEVLTCECSSRSCQTVFWFRTLHNNLDIQFLLSLNNAGRTSHEPSVDEHRFKASKRDGGSKITFTLRLINISSEDAGLYTCMLQNQKENELWRPGVLLRPGGESNPFPCMALTIPNSIPNGRCTKSNYHAAGPGCGSKVLWPLVGVLLALAVALISTLYYFSRDYSAVLNSFFACATGLPKKCRHQYAK